MGRIATTANSVRIQLYGAQFASTLNELYMVAAAGEKSTLCSLPQLPAAQRFQAAAPPRPAANSCLPPRCRQEGCLALQLSFDPACTRRDSATSKQIHKRLWISTPVGAERNAMK